jgi:MerC mercury resistance protein
MGEEKIDKGYDMAGITSALLCTVHCLVIPALFLLKFSWTDNNNIKLPDWWESVDYVFLVISFIAVFHSARHTPAKAIKVSLWLFWSILAVAIIFSKDFHWLAYVASAGLITTHFLNILRMKRNAVE